MLRKALVMVDPDKSRAEINECLARALGVGCYHREDAFDGRQTRACADGRVQKTAESGFAEEVHPSRLICYARSRLRIQRIA